MVIDGKYCQISIILSDLLNFKSTSELEILNKAADSIKDEIYLYEKIRTDLGALNGMESNKSSRYATKLRYFYSILSGPRKLR